MIKNSETATEAAWERFRQIWLRQIKDPGLLESAAHIAAREIAHARFVTAYQGQTDEQR